MNTKCTLAISLALVAFAAGAARADYDPWRDAADTAMIKGNASVESRPGSPRSVSQALHLRPRTARPKSLAPRFKTPVRRMKRIRSRAR